MLPISKKSMASFGSMYPPADSSSEGNTRAVSSMFRVGRAIKHGCTTGKERRITRWEHEHILEAVQRRLDEHPEKMRERRETVEHPFGTIKARMGATHFLMKTYHYGAVFGGAVHSITSGPHFILLENRRPLAPCWQVAPE